MIGFFFVVDNMVVALNFNWYVFCVDIYSNEVLVDNLVVELN
jgi:hypothetical protein